MAQAKKKTATKTAKKMQVCPKAKSCSAKKCQQKQKQQQNSNMFFVISMSVLAATLLFANLMMIAA